MIPEISNVWEKSTIIPAVFLDLSDSIEFIY